MSQSSLDLFLQRARRESYTPAAHQLVLTLGRHSPTQMESLLGQLAPRASWQTQASARYALDPRGHGLRIGVEQVGGTPGEAADHHFTLHLPEVSLTTIVAEGYLQPEVVLLAEADERRALERLPQHFSARSTRWLRFGRATLADLEPVVELIREIFENEYDMVFDPGFDTPDIEAADAFLVLSEGRHVRACCAFWLHPEHAELKTLYVHESLRRLGWGGRLVNQIRHLTEQSGRRRLELWSDTRFLAAHRLYRRLGFRQGGERPLADANNSREYRFTLQL